jgi:acetolactate synthase-1/2/3 large subunit
VGAALLDRDRPVVALSGDGGLLMCLAEIATAVREKLRLVVVVFHDASLSLIEIKQQARKLAPGGVALGHIDWATLGASLGAATWSAGDRPGLERAIDQAAAHDGVSLVEARIDRSNYGAILQAIRG